MTGTKSGLVGYLRNHFLATKLWKSALDMKNVLNDVIKLVNSIRSRALKHRQFREFLDSLQSEYSDVLYYTKVRWLSAGRVFERVWDL